MTYTMKYCDWQWLIEPEPRGQRYLLKYRRPSAWTNCRSYETPEAAAEAVANGTTGEKDWDSMKRDAPLPSLASWLIDPAGGPLGIVTGIVEAAIAPSEHEAAKRS
jgi:hypothetical protein